MEKQYCIKTGYRSNEQSLTLGEDKNESFWEDWRIEMAGKHQFYVYKKCQWLLKKYQYKNLLDLGCGPPLKVKQLLFPYCEEITLVDQPVVAKLAEQILPECEFIPANLEKNDIQLLRKFDLIVCSDVIEHLLNPNNCVELIKDHLTPGGLAVISTPERDYLRGRHCNYSPKPEHVREWNSAEFVAYITSRGLNIVEHELLPQTRISHLEYWFCRILSQFIRTRRWSSCQTIVCQSAH